MTKKRMMYYLDGTYGKEHTIEIVGEPKIRHEPWEMDGKMLIHLVVTLPDGSTKQLPNIQTNYDIYEID